MRGPDRVDVVRRFPPVIWIAAENKHVKCRCRCTTQLHHICITGVLRIYITFAMTLLNGQQDHLHYTSKSLRYSRLYSITFDTIVLKYSITYSSILVYTSYLSCCDLDFVWMNGKAATK